MQRHKSSALLHLKRFTLRKLKELFNSQPEQNVFLQMLP
ncbi:hypothetical protein ACP4OV_027175 [Aristida adscensionis]